MSWNFVNGIKSRGRRFAERSAIPGREEGEGEGRSIDDYSGSGGAAHGWDEDDDHNRESISRVTIFRV